MVLNQLAPLLLLFGPVLGSKAPGQDIEKLLRDIRSSDPAAQMAAAEKLGQGGLEAVGPLSDLLESIQPAAAHAASSALQGIAHRAARPGAEAERVSAARAFAEALARDRPARARSVLLDLLGLIGGAESVPAVAKELDAPETRHMACRALSRISAPEAAQALLDALQKKGQDEMLQIALLNAIGLKRDMAAAQTLSELAQGASPVEVRFAALDALARNPLAYSYQYIFWDALASTKAMKQPRLRCRAWDNLLRVAEAFIEVGEFGNASDLCSELLQNAKTRAEKCSAIIGLGRGSRRLAPGLVFDALKDRDPVIRGTARMALQYLRWGIFSITVKKLLSESPPPLLILILEGVASREEPEAATLAAPLLGHEDPAVRAAALRALEGRSSGKAAGALVERILDGSPLLGEGGLGVLARMPGDEVTGVIVEGARNADPGGRARLLRVLALRQAPGAEELFLESARSRSEEVRVAAYPGLASLGGIGSLEVLLGGLDRGGPEATAAAEAISRLPFPEAIPPLIRAASARKGAGRASLIRILGGHGSAAITDFLLDEARSADREVRIAAVRGLCSQDDPRILPVLLEASRSGGPEEVRNAAVLACLRFAGTMEKQNPDRALAIYHRTCDPGTRSRPPEIIAALEGMGRLAHPGSIPVLKSLLEKKQFRQQAASALLLAAVKLGPERRDEVIELLGTAIPLAPASPGARAAVEKLRELGVDHDVAGQSGFISRWWLLGPFENPENNLFQKDLISPENVEVGENKAVKAGGQTIRWRRHQGLNPLGIIDLGAALAQREWVGAYAYTELPAAEMKRVTFKFGSDDSLVAWLNGKKIHAFGGARGVTVDQESVDAKLEPGKNRILLKVLNQGGGWAFCLRITDRTGAPLVLKKKSESF